jgi:hypothetical protein
MKKGKKMRLKSILLLAIVVMASVMFAVPSLAETQDECIARCNKGSGGPFGYLAAKDCRERYCYKSKTPPEEISANCDALINVVIRARLKWLDGGDLDLLVDQILRERTPLTSPVRDYLLTGSPIALANIKAACTRR